MLALTIGTWSAGPYLVVSMPIEMHHEHDTTYRLDISRSLGRSEFAACTAQLAAAIRQQGAVKLLCVLHAFEGWESHEGWSDMGFYTKNGDAIARIAIVGNERWRDESLMFAAAGLRRAPVEYFQETDLAKARAWLSAETSPSNTHERL
jgi:hypothetical protein